jgi:cytochrome P450
MVSSCACRRNRYDLTQAGGPTVQSDERDYFTDHSVLSDPYEYFEELRSKCPVHQLTKRDIVFVTGFEEAVQVLRNTEDFSSIIAPVGAAVPLPFEPQGGDISEQIHRHRSQIPASDLLVAYDGAQHSASRSILTKLFVPSRLKANEAFMRELADKVVKAAVVRGKCELIKEVAASYVTLVIADLLGVPEDDRELFRQKIDEAPPAGNMDAEDKPHEGSTLEYLAGFFVRYIQERRANPRNDILTELATATYPDGSMPDVMEVVRLATFLFAAGQDTSAKLLGNCMRFITENPELQKALRENRELIAPFIEEVLRLEGSTKATFRLARKNTKIGDKEIPAGKKVVVALAATNRDPRRWKDPKQFKLDREKIKEHLAFGRGAHTCVGAPLARAEVRVVLDSFFEHTSDISLSEEKHGPPGNRRLNYEASFIIRGLEELFLELKPR